MALAAPVALAKSAAVINVEVEEALQKLRPVFDRNAGDVTVGNACQITDGAVALLCTSEARAKATSIQVNASDLSDPAKVKQFQEAQTSLLRLPVSAGPPSVPSFRARYRRQNLSEGK